MAAAAGEHGAKAVWYPTAEELIAALPALLQKGDRVLVKASLGMHMERAAEAVKKGIDVRSVDAKNLRLFGK